MSLTEADILKITSSYFRQKRVNAWAVGGYVRDRLMKRAFSKDIDIALPGETLGHGRALARLLKGTVVPLSKAFGITRIALRGGVTVDLSRLRGKTIESDLLKRDFTINAIAFPLSSPEVFIDPSGGRADLKVGIVRMVCKEAFQDDPVRLLRAFRFSATLGFSIEKTTLCEIKERAGLLHSPASERIRDEFLKLLSSKDPIPSLLAADSAGVLCGLFPELFALKGVEQPGYHHLDVFEHTLEAVKLLQNISSLSDFKIEKSTRAFTLDRLRERRGQFDVLTHLKFICLFHDIAKPETKTPGEDGGAHFYNHELLGAKTFSAIARRMKLSNLEIEAGVKVIKNHLRTGYLAGLKDISKRSVLRLLRETGEFTVEVLLLSWADRLSALGPKIKKSDIEAQRKVISMLLDENYRLSTEKPLPKIINGEAVMKKFKLKPSPELGKLLAAVKEGQLLGTVVTRKDAFELIRGLINKGA